MCLQKVEAPKKRFGIGYKSVDKRGDEYYSYDYQLKAGYCYGKAGQWITDTNKEPIHVRGIEDYEPGFHIMLTIPNRVRFGHTIIKIRFRKAHAGQSNDYIYGDQVVAKEMKIIEEV